MKTPITDKAFADAAKVNPSPSLMNLGILARRLELDRAALMDALAKIAHNPGDCDNETGFTSGHIARAALSAARANFPD